MLFDFIKNHRKIFPIEKMCKVLKVSQSGYYRWKIAGTSKRLHKKSVLKEKITALYFEFKPRYGSPRITMELNILGYQISRPESLLELAKHYIEIWYHQKRRHSALKYMIIKEFANQSNNYKNVA